MTWSDAAWLAVAARVAALIVCYVIALIQIMRADRLGTVGRLAWVVGVVLVPYIGAAAWFAYGRPWTRSFAPPEA